MEKKYTYVVSDLHIGKTPEKNVKLFVSFLQWLRGGQAATLILLGDIFDEWLCGFAMTPAEVEKVRKRFECDAAAVISALRECEAAGVKIVYVLGNHDLLIEETLPDLKRWVVGEKYLGLPNAIFMHGHQFDAFNSTRFIPSTEETGFGKYPLGYYIARATRRSASPSTGGKYSYVTHALQHLDSLGGVVIDMILSSNPHAPLIQAIFSFLGVGPKTEVTVAKGIVTTIEKVTEAYASTFKAATSAMGPYHEMLEAAAGNLEGMVERFCSAYRLVVVGHIHSAGHKLIERSTGSRTLYCSTGSWKKDGSIVGLRIGDHPEFWKLGPTSAKPTLLSKVKPKCRTKNWLDIYRLYSLGDIEGTFANLHHFEEIFVENVGIRPVRALCAKCRVATLLDLASVTTGLQASVICHSCRSVYAAGSREASKKKALFSLANAYRREVIRRKDLQSIASLLECASKACECRRQ